MVEAGGLRRARRTLAALEAALALEEENSDIPARVLVEHLVDTRRKQKLLLTQLRVLCQLLGVIESPGPHLAPLAPCEAGALAQARERWRELKAECEEVLGGALPSALTRLRKGQCLLQRLQGALEARLQQKEELEAELREALERREQLRGRVAEQRQERLSRQEALRHCQEAALRAEASCRLYRMLTGGLGAAPRPGGPCDGAPPPAHHLHHSPQGAPLPAAPLVTDWCCWRAPHPCEPRKEATPLPSNKFIAPRAAAAAAAAASSP